MRFTPATDPRKSRALQAKQIEPKTAAQQSNSYLTTHLPLSRMLGNQDMCHFAQAKLKVGAPGDKYEREADRVADRIMGMAADGEVHVSRGGERLQRRCAACASGQGLCGECEQEQNPELRRQPASGQTPRIGPRARAKIHYLNYGGRPLPDDTRSFFESRFGRDFSRVRVHTDTAAEESARDINAQAFTHGRHIVFAAGKFDPASGAGQRLLAHELTHVIQQSGGERGSMPLQAASEDMVQRTPQGLDDPIHAPLIEEYRRQHGLPPGGVDEQGRPVGPSAGEIKYGGLLQQPPPPGIDPAVCLTPLCDQLRHPSRACRRDPLICAADWIDDVMACLRQGAQASNATLYREILQNTRTDLEAQVADMNRAFGGAPSTRADRDEYLDWLARVCAHQQRELGIEFRYNVVFARGTRPWMWAMDPLSGWDAIEETLAAIPEEHLRTRRSGPRVITFLRSSYSGNTAGSTDQSTGDITIYNAGIGTQPMHRSRGLAISTTQQAIRHEVGHIVEGIVGQREFERFFDQILSWYSYPKYWVNVPTRPTCSTPPRQGLANERCRICGDLGLRDASGVCDDTELDRVLHVVDGGTAERVGKRTVIKAGDHFVESFITAGVPSHAAFEYARTGRGEYFAEIYAFALTIPEFLHQQLSIQQINWLREHVFDTQRHYDELIHFPVVAIHNPAWERRYDLLKIQAKQAFTRRQLLAIREQIALLLQQMSFDVPGRYVA